MFSFSSSLRHVVTDRYLQHIVFRLTAARVEGQEFHRGKALLNPETQEEPGAVIFRSNSCSMPLVHCVEDIGPLRAWCQVCGCFACVCMGTRGDSSVTFSLWQSRALTRKVLLVFSGYGSNLRGLQSVSSGKYVHVYTYTRFRSHPGREIRPRTGEWICQYVCLCLEPFF